MEYSEIKITGLREMQNRLMELPAKIARKILVSSVREGAKVIRDYSREKAPIGTKTYKDWKGRIHRPGTLKKSGVIYKKLKTRDWRGKALFGVGFSKRGYYGTWIERGKSKKHHYDPHPFIGPAMEQKADEAVNAVKTKLGEELRRMASQTPGMSAK